LRATVSIKVVPGASASRVVRRYGDAFKVQVKAPPEQGKANRAVVELLASALNVRPQRVTIARGHGQARKVVQVDGIEQSEAERMLGSL
jgi:hypothetical protein